MRVLHLVKTSVGATWAYRQMRELVKRGIEVHVALPEAGPLVEAYEKAGVQVHLADVSFSPRRVVHTWAAVRRLRQLVQDIQPDLLHSHFVNTTLTMRLALRRISIPRVFQVPGPLHLEHPLFKAAEIASSTADDYWIGSCRWTQAAYIRAGIPSHRVFMSFYGMDLPDQPSQKGQLRQQLGLSDDVFIVGMVAFMYAPKRYLGQTRGLKGHEDLIDALALCRQRGLPVKGVFVGAAWDGAIQYEHAITTYGKARLGDDVFFLGTRHDVFHLYPDFDVAVHPSHSENLGGASESLALGVPTIATAVGGFPDIVIPGQTGWLVPAKQPAALAEAITTVLANREAARAVAAAGRMLVREVLAVPRTAEEIHTIYGQILQNYKSWANPY